MCLVSDPPSIGPLYALYEKDKPNTPWPSPTGWHEKYLFSTEERRTLYIVAKGIEGLTGLSKATPRTKTNNGHCVSTCGRYMIEDKRLDWPLYCH